MTALTFDTHAAVKAMRDAGAAEPLAEAIVSAIQASTRHLDDLASKDLVTKAYFKAELGKYATKADFENFERRLTIRFGWMLLAAAGLTLVAVKFL